MICLTVSALLLSALCACGAEKTVPSEPDEAEIDESYQDLWQEEEKTEDFRQEELWEAENDFPLTVLNRSNAICLIYQSGNIPKGLCALRLLMDDNVTYVYNGDNG